MKTTFSDIITLRDRYIKSSEELASSSEEVNTASEEITAIAQQMSIEAQKEEKGDFDSLNITKEL